MCRSVLRREEFFGCAGEEVFDVAGCGFAGAEEGVLYDGLAEGDVGSDLLAAYDVFAERAIHAVEGDFARTPEGQELTDHAVVVW